MRKISFKSSQRTFDKKEVYQSVTDLLLSRIKLLSGKDKLLLTMYLEKGNSFREIARLAGINERNIARRIRKIAKRLMDGEYITCLRNRDKFSTIEMSIAKQYFLSGLSIREIAAKQHFTYYRTRKIVKKIQCLLASARQPKSMAKPSDLIKLTKGQQLCLHTLSQEHSNYLPQQAGRDILPIKSLMYAECSA